MVAHNAVNRRSVAGRYYVATFGCRVNQADSAGIVGELERSDLVRTRDQNEADLIVLNTCTVTHRADTDVRKEVSRIRRENPSARVVVTGCFAQRDPNAVAAIEGVHAVVGNAHKSRLPILVEELCEQPVQPIVLHSPMEDDVPPVEPHATVVDRTRPFIKIQDGCDATCTYCIIPSVRGPARSANMEDVLRTVRELVDQGWFEIVLTGVHLGTYREGLAELVRRVLELPDLGRLRMSCIEPMAFPIELADIAREDRRLAPHFHLPLQAGSDRILKRMVRPYRARDYVDQIAAVRARLPDVCIGTDVIVGFPGETDAEFHETMRVVEQTVDYVHVFSYSDREGTASTRLDGKIDPRVIKLRSDELHRLGDRLWTRHLDRQIGRVLPAVTLDDRTALTENYCQVRVDATMPNQPCSVRVVSREGRRLSGIMAER
jgi:threonylcarbamoyladenosine tRNA methylthiotransferase MtaB